MTRSFLAKSWLRVAILASALWPGTPVHAHQMPSTAVMLDFHRDAVAAELILPLQELQLAFKQPLLAAPEEVILKYGPALDAYLLSHVHATAPDGRPWTVEASDLRVKLGEQPVDLIAHLWMRPPAGAPLRKFTFSYDVIVHEVVSHKSFVFIRNDWNEARFLPTGQVPPMPEAMGLIRYLNYAVPIDRTHGSWWQGFRSVLKLGIHHIAEGTDHLLFLLVLLLPAPLLTAGAYWGRYAGSRRSLWRLFKIVTAFTVGHSITLALAGTHLVRLPAHPIEVLIALSILVSAVHALKPIFPGREPWIAAGFGLIHGLAFADTIADFGFSPWYLAMSILGFNLGIELMQMAVVLVTIPWLLLLARTRFYPPVRIGGAVFGGVAALTWIGERAFAWPNPFDAWVTALAHHAGWIVAGLAALSLAATWQRQARPLKE